MASSDRVYRTSVVVSADTDATGLESRWTEASLGRLREAISSSNALPRSFQPIEISFGDSTVMVEDLRGADLSGLEIGSYDLAYCALDYAKFEHSRLVGTKLQYSRLIGASFRSARLEAIQGSPIDAQDADFSHSRLAASFFSHSNFDGALSDSTEVRDCDFTECSSPLESGGVDKLKFVYSASNNETLVRRVVEYLEAKPSSTSFKHVISPIFKKGVTKVGRVAVGSSHADYVVIVHSKPRQTVGGKIIKKYIECKISAATTPFSVGDAVRITSLEVDERFALKVFASRKPTLSKTQVSAPKLYKSPSWWILGSASSEESGGLEAAEA